MKNSARQRYQQARRKALIQLKKEHKLDYFRLLGYFLLRRPRSVGNT